MNFKKILTRIFFTSAFLFSVLFPQTIFAKNDLLGSLCTKLDTVQSLATKKIDSINGSIAEKRLIREDKKIQTRQVQDKALSSDRTLSDQKLQALIEKLKNTASTDIQKRAVTDFQEAIAIALQNRRIAVDDALQTSRGATDRALSDRKMQIAAAENQLQIAAQTILQNTKAQCALGTIDVFGSTSPVAQARAAYHHFLESIGQEALRVTLQKINTTKSAEIEAAQKIYENQKQLLLAKLKSAVQ